MTFETETETETETVIVGIVTGNVNAIEIGTVNETGIVSASATVIVNGIGIMIVHLVLDATSLWLIMIVNDGIAKKSVSAHTAGVSSSVTSKASTMVMKSQACLGDAAPMTMTSVARIPENRR